MSNQYKGIEHNWVILFEAKGLCSVEDVLDVTLTSIISVKVEEGEEVFDFFGGEDGVFGDNILCENDGSLFFDDLFLVYGGHLLQLIYFCRY